MLTWQHIWAKWRDGDRYALTAHLVDTAAAMAVLHDQWLPDGLKARLAEMLDVDTEGLRTLLVSGAAFHDIGKATWVFQTQALSSFRTSEFDGHRKDLEAAGAPPTGLGGLNDDSRGLLRRHEVASAVVLKGAYETATTSRTVGAVVAGHHGRWHSTTVGGGILARPRAEKVYAEIISSEWGTVQQHIISAVAEATGSDSNAAVADMAAVPVLTGLVCLADWLASAAAEEDGWDGWQQKGTFNSPEVDWAALHARRTAEFERRVAHTLGRPNLPDDRNGALHEVFERIVPGRERPAQAALFTEHAPGLTVVTVPTGEGKTEAAIGHWLVNSADRRGLYFALPARAVADAMFDRFRTVFGRLKDNNLAELAHGHAARNSFYQLGHSADQRTAPARSGDPSGGLRPGDWFKDGRHRSLFAPIVVGTFDQGLLAATRSRFGFVRLAALATKTVVFDEVHSYDPYTSRLLERFLTWAGELKIDVVLLSATLPTGRLNAYLDAYTTGQAGPVEPHYPGVVRTSPDGPAVSSPLAPVATRTVRVEPFEVPYEQQARAAVTAALVRRLQAAHPNARIGVIVNTVARCQQVARALADLDPDVLHSRFPQVVRRRLVDQTISRYGPDAPDGPALLVATQVVEQSIDLDFDILITDTATVAALLQRIGRLWRHDRDGRTGIPTVHVLHVTDPDCPPWAHLPYSPLDIAAAAAGLNLVGDGTSVSIPGDVQRLVDNADITLETLEEQLGSDAEQPVGIATIEDEWAAIVTKVLAAGENLIPTPEQLRARPPDLRRFGENSGQTPTRWDDLGSVDVLVIGQSSPKATTPTDLDAATDPSHGDVEGLGADGIWTGPLTRTDAVPPEALDGLMSLPLPTADQLKRKYPGIVTASDGTLLVPPSLLDPALGLLTSERTHPDG